MDLGQILNNFVQGLGISLQPDNLLWVLFGTAWGILGGAMPGISSSVTIALLLPLTYAMKPESAVMMLAGGLVGAGYGGSIPAILIRTPGIPSAVVTILDGYQLHLQGKSGKALGISLFTGTVGSFLGIVSLIVFVIPLSILALKFHPPEVFAFALFGLTAASSLVGKNLFKGLAAAFFGMAVMTAGLDPMTGAQRFLYGKVEMAEGFSVVAVVIGLLAVSEVFKGARQMVPWGKIVGKFSPDLPNWQELKSVTKATLIASFIGIIAGIMPGAGGTAASFISYNEARRWSTHPEEFGKGSLEGVAAAETANNAVVGGDLVPTLGIGVPGSVSSGIIIVALMLHGIQPGPLLMQNYPKIVYSLFGGLMTSSVFMLLLGLLTIKPSVYIASLSRPIIAVGTLALVTVGIFSINYLLFDVFVALAFGVVGYFMALYGYPVATAALGIILGPIVEVNFRRALAMSQGSIAIFFTRPITIFFLLGAFLTAIYPFLMDWLGRRKEKAQVGVVESAVQAAPTESSSEGGDPRT